MNLVKILKNASYLFIGNIGIRVITAITTILLARFIGPEAYGIFTIAIALSGIAGFFADMGLTETFIREANKKDTNMSQLLFSYLKVRIFLSICAALISCFFINTFYNSDLIYIINWIVYPTIIGTTFQGTATAFFQSKERMGYSSTLVVIQGILAASSTLLAIIFNWPMSLLAPVYGCSFIITGIISLIILLKFASFKKGWNRRILDQLFAFSINGFIMVMLPQLGPIILEKVATLSNVGYFSSAYKIPSVLYQIPGVIAAAFYPRLFILGNMEDDHSHRQLSKVELKLMSFVGIGISLPFIIAPEFWIVNLLGAEWKKASIALSIVSYMVILQSINYPLADYLTTKGQQYKRMLVMAIGLTVAIISYTLLGKNFGLIGGAFSPLLIEFTLLIGYCFFMKRSLLFLFEGVKYNVLSFLICRLIAYFIPTSKLTLLWLIAIGILYILLVLMLDKTLINKLTGYMESKRLEKSRNQL